ncbi:MAG TPA: hypothetical protein VMZ25_11470 [Terriglobales bacterium]|nr:hypothetical protein [Terriglobales bacterium]
MSVTHDNHAALPVHVTPEYVAAPWWADHMRKRWSLVAGIAAAIAVVGAVLALQAGTYVAINHFMRAYLVGFMFCLGLTTGSMALLMLQHVTGGKWGLVIRRQLEAGTRNWWLAALMFVPIALGLKYLYPWAGGMELSFHGEHAFHVRHEYLNPTMFIGRAILYFLGWGAFIYFFLKWSPLQDVPQASPEAANRLRLRFMRLGGGGLVFYAITISLAAIDWVMSLDPVWYSTIWGMLYMAGQALHTMAFMLVVLIGLARYEPMKSLLRKTELHDNGKLLLAFVMLYMYLSFSQFIIIWSGNLTEEIPWYLARIRGGWRPVMVGLFLFHFVVPFLLLLNRNLKKHGPRLAAVAILIIFVRYVDLYWHIVPNFRDAAGWAPPGEAVAGGFSPNLWDLIVPAAMAATWIALFFYNLTKRPLIPVYHPLVPEILEPSHGAH